MGIRNWTLWSWPENCEALKTNACLSSLPLLTPRSCWSLSATVPMLLSNKGGVPRAGVPQECQPFPSLAFRAPHLPAQLAEGLCKRQSGLGEGQRLGWLVGKWEASTKSFQTKGINIICGAIRLPGAQYGSGLAKCSVPTFCVKAWWGLSRHILGRNANTLKGFPHSPLLLSCLLRLSLSRLNNGWTLIGSRCVQGRSLTEGKWSDGRTIMNRWHCWEWIPDKFTSRLSSDKDLSDGKQLAPSTKPLLKTFIPLSHTIFDSSKSGQLPRFCLTGIPQFSSIGQSLEASNQQSYLSTFS